MKDLSKCQEMLTIQQQNFFHIIKTVGIDLSRQTNKSISQKLNFLIKLEENNGPTIFFITKKKELTILNFSKIT